MKELTALHQTARLLQNHQRQIEDLIREVAALLPVAWQYPEIAGARINFNGHEAATPNFRKSEWTQRADFKNPGAVEGFIEIAYLEPRPQAFEGPFLKEERELIDSLADMLGSYLRHRQSDEDLQKAREELEHKVHERTEELLKVNTTLKAQIEEQRRAEKRIRDYQAQLRRLTSELTLTEARERREIASDLHDHLGQSLAYLKVKVSQLSGKGSPGGPGDIIQEISTLLDQAIASTRTLTTQISPPILYELGLNPALEWLSEQFQNKYHLDIKVRIINYLGEVENEVAIFLFKSVHELLNNVVKHAQAARAEIVMEANPQYLLISVQDDGCGFNQGEVEINAYAACRFGLFSIRERLKALGGNMTINTGPGQGTRVTMAAPRHRGNK